MLLNNPQQLEAIYLLTHTTLKKNKIAEMINVHPTTISRWFQDEDFVKVYDAEMRNSFKEYAFDARQEVLEIMLNGENEKNRLSAAKDILSRAGYDATNKVEQLSETTIVVSIDEND